MEIGMCPYCQLYGLVTRLRLTPGGFVQTAKCSACGYTCESGPAAEGANRSAAAFAPAAHPAPDSERR